MAIDAGGSIARNQSAYTPGPYPEERRLRRVSKDRREPMRCGHPSRRIARAMLLRMRSNFGNAVLANSPRQPQHEDQHFGHRLVEFRGNFIAEFDVGQRPGQHFVFLDRDAMLFGHLDDLGADAALALGDHARRAGAVVMQRDRELSLGLFAHSARSRKCPALVKTGCGGAPSRITMSPGRNSALLSAWLSCDT